MIIAEEELIHSHWWKQVNEFRIWDRWHEHKSRNELYLQKYYLLENGQDKMPQHIPIIGGKVKPPWLSSLSIRTSFAQPSEFVTSNQCLTVQFQTIFGRTSLCHIPATELGVVAFIAWCLSSWMMWWKSQGPTLKCTDFNINKNETYYNLNKEENIPNRLLTKALESYQICSLPQDTSQMGYTCKV